jgi:hypothetical protein
LIPFTFARGRASFQVSVRSKAGRGMVELATESSARRRTVNMATSTRRGCSAVCSRAVLLPCAAAVQTPGRVKRHRALARSASRTRTRRRRSCGTELIHRHPKKQLFHHRLAIDPPSLSSPNETRAVSRTRMRVSDANCIEKQTTIHTDSDAF